MKVAATGKGLRGREVGRGGGGSGRGGGGLGFPEEGRSGAQAKLAETVLAWTGLA